MRAQELQKRSQIHGLRESMRQSGAKNFQKLTAIDRQADALEARALVADR